MPEAEARHGTGGFLPETRRFAAIKGATTEIRKEEGITYDPDHHKLYVAISEISRGMEDSMKNGKPSTAFDVPSANHIKVPYNLCGGVYELSLDDKFVATDMKGLGGRQAGQIR